MQYKGLLVRGRDEKQPPKAWSLRRDGRGLAQGEGAGREELLEEKQKKKHKGRGENQEKQTLLSRRMSSHTPKATRIPANNLIPLVLACESLLAPP